MLIKEVAQLQVAISELEESMTRFKLTPVGPLVEDLSDGTRA